jgi:cytochrome c oxidase assembly protein subunit 15
MLNKSLFRRINFLTIIAVYLLILIGGIVRTTGAGMGCPDWPKCFDSYIPPISENELPDNYQEQFLAKRIEKNERLTRTLISLGLNDIAYRISNDPAIKIEEDFSPVKAWIEYINRLIGVVIGLFILASTVTSWSYRKDDVWVPFWSTFGLILVLFQGWIGSLVVSTNLLPGFVSFHMSLAFLLIAVLIYAQFRASKKKVLMSKQTSRLTGLLLLLIVPQIFLGTQVREVVDSLVSAGIGRGEWMMNMDWKFYVHRSYSLILMLLMIWFVYNTYKERIIQNWTLPKVILSLILLEIVGGAIMAYFSVPAFLQPIHLTAASILFGLLFYLFLQAKTEQKTI